MRFTWRRYFSIKKFLQSLATILLGLIAFLYAFRAWSDTAQELDQPRKSDELEVILIHGGDSKLVKAKLRSLACALAKAHTAIT